MITPSWKRIAVGTALGLGALVVGVWLLGRTLVARSNADFSCQGRPLGYWLEQLKGRDAAASNRAGIVLLTQITPQLTNQMLHDTNDSSLEMALVDKFNNLELPGIAHINFASAEFRRAAAARWLGEFGPLSRPAVPVLLQVLRGNDNLVRVRVAASLGQIHSDPEIVIPALIHCLSDPRSDLRTEAAEALAGWGKQSQAAVPRLIQLLDDRSDRDLMAAVRKALKEIDPDAAAKSGVK